MSSASFDPVHGQIEDYSDRVFRGEPAARGDLDPSLADAIQFLHQLDHLPTVDTSAIRKRKEDFMNASATVSPWDVAPVSQNGQKPYSTPAGNRAVRVWNRPHGLLFASAAIVVAIIASLLLGGIYWTQRDHSSHPAAVPAAQETPTAETGAGWPMFRGNAARTGYSSDPGPGSDLGLRWSFTVDQIVKTVTMGDGHVYAATPDGTVYALDPNTGEQIWARDFSAQAYPPPHRVPPPVPSDGTLYVPTFDGVLFAVDSDTGTTQWQKQISSEPILGPPAIADGVIYLNINGTDIVAVDATDGHQLWDWTSANGIDWFPPSIGEGKVYTPDIAGNVVALDATNGVVDWIAAVGDAHRVAAYQGGKVYVPGQMGTLYAIDASNGSLIWTSESVESATLNPVITPNIAVLGGESVMLGIDLETGKTLWTADGPREGGSPHGGSAGIYVGGAAGTFQALDLQTGNVIGESGIADVGPTAAISGNMIVISSLAEPGAGSQNGQPAVVRAYGPGEGTPNEVTAVPPPMLDQTTASSASPSALEGEVSPIGATLQASHTVDPSRPTIALVIDRDGRILRFTDETSQLELYDRDENLLATYTFGSGVASNMFDWSVSNASGTWSGTGAVSLPDGTLHIVDTGNSRIQIVNPADGFRFTGSWGPGGKADGQLLNPADILLGDNNEYIIADVGRNDIQWFSMDGQFLRKLTGPDATTAFQRPSKIVLDQSGNLWVLDSGASRVYKFDADNQLLMTIGASTSASGFDQFDRPNSIAVDGGGRLWVADTGNARIQVFDGDGTPAGTFDACQTESGCLQAPNVVIDGGNGIIFINDQDPTGATGDRMLKFKIGDAVPVPGATPASR